MTPMEMVTCECGKRESLEKAVIDKDGLWACRDCQEHADHIFPVITLYQPWATWIMREWKTIETRTHDRFKCLNGRTILIHAGMKTDESAAYNPYLTPEQIFYNPDEVVNGCILGSAYVDGFSRLCQEHAKEALIECVTPRFGLFLTNIDVFDEPIPAKGEMGIWYYDLKNREKVKEAKVVQMKKDLFSK